MSETGRSDQPEPSADQLKRTSRNFMALGMGNYGAMAISVVTNALLARRLGAEQWGSLALLLMASQVLLLVAVNWTHAGFVRFGSIEFAASREVRETLSVRLSLLWPTAGLGLLIMALARQPLAAYLGIPPVAIWLLVVHFTAACALSLIGAIFQARDQMARYGACLLLDKAGMLVCVALLPAAWTQHALAALACYAASSLAVAIWGVSVVGLTALRPVWPAAGPFRQMLAFSAPLLLTSWAGLFGTSWFDLVILKQHVPMSGLGVYSLSTQLAGVTQQVTVIFATLMLPEVSVMVAGGQDERIKTMMERLLPYWLLAISILFGLVLLLSRSVVPFVFGGTYVDAPAVLALLMLASTTLALHNACTPLVTAYGATWVLTGVAFASITVNIAMDLLLIPRYGVGGSAVATFLAYTTSTVIVGLVVQKRTGGRILRMLWLGTPVLTVYAAFVLLDGFWFYPIAIVASVVNVVVLVLAFRLFRAEDAAFFRGLHLRMPFGWGAGSLAGKGL